MQKIIFFELNEVPLRILDEYCKWRPKSNFAQFIPRSSKYQTVAEDFPGEPSHLSPWITWPSLHRGVSNEKHCIQDFGQDLSEVDKEFPSLWNILAASGIQTGVCGSLHSYPLPKSPENYSFFLPDTFAAGSECFPEKLSVFQEFNLSMARASAKNVSTKVPWKAGLDLLAAVPQLGLKASTFADVGMHLVNEKLNPARKSRRRTYQSVLAFDVFMKYLSDTKPDFATFFTNHVASAMHRYWAAAFPKDYENFGYDEDWIRTFDGEIQFAMDRADAFFGRMVAFTKENPDYVIWVTSSMGQAATNADPVYSQLYATEPVQFMAGLGFDESEWKMMPAMMPQFNFRVNPDQSERFGDALGNLRVNGESINFREASAGFFSVDLGHYNLDEKTLFLTWKGERVSPNQFGLSNVQIEDLTGANAYHIPEGCLFIYDPKNDSIKRGETTISALEIAPAILRNYSVPIPSYMRSAPKLEGVGG